MNATGHARLLRPLDGLMCFLLALGVVSPAATQELERPNILWLTSEDNGPHLGAYGDPHARTPHLDGLARRGLVYTSVWSNAPVCAPARTAVISGLYPTTTGAQHMRSLVRLPEGLRFFPQLLREAGYYTTNNAKEDYNLEKPGRVWDESSREAHWRNRPPGTPFFAVFNFTVTHESQIRRRPHTAVTDPASVTPPPYHPDTLEVRRDWAQYYDKLAEMDALVGARLRELEEDGLRESTIVVYWGDHGVGLPRGKRTPLDTGLLVPLIVHIPERWAHLRPPEYVPGAETSRLVAFVDLAPSTLRLAGLEAPDDYQGRSFLGADAPPPKRYLFGFRDRMDERYDLIRTVRDGRYLYVRNFMPHRPSGAYLAYLFQTPTTQVWHRLFTEGRLEPHQAAFFEPKPSEELYDLRTDPHQVVDLLAGEVEPDVEAIASRLRARLRDHLLATRDLGFLPESLMHERAGDGTPYELGAERPAALAVALDAAELASRRSPDDEELAEAMASRDPAVRFWAARGCIVRGRAAVERHVEALRRLLEDRTVAVRIEAAEALGRYSGPDDARRAARTLREVLDRVSGIVVDSPSGLERYFDAAHALNSIEAIAPGAATPQIDFVPPTGVERRYAGYLDRLRERIERVVAGG